MNYMSLLQGSFLFIVAHVIVWFQLNGQFKWGWCAKNYLLLTLLGIPISFFYLWGTRFTVEGFGGLLWPARFVGFGVGIIIYGILVSYYFNEGISLKTFVSLLLAISIICIQAFWK